MPYTWASNGVAWLVQAFRRLITVHPSWVNTCAPLVWGTIVVVWLVQAFLRLITVAVS